MSSCLAYMLRSRRLNTGWACCLQHSVAPCWAGQHLSASEDAHRVHRPISIAPEQSALTLHSLHPAFAYHTVSERMTPTSAACKWVVRVWRVQAEKGGSLTPSRQERVWLQGSTGTAVSIMHTETGRKGRTVRRQLTVLLEMAP